MNDSQVIHKVFHRVVLASQSQARRLLLKHLGIPFETFPTHMDESQIKQDHMAVQKSAAEAAMALAVAKAFDASQIIKDPDAYIIGADQILLCRGRWFDKARDVEEAFEQLQFLRNSVHELCTAVCVVRNNQIVWQHLEVPKLHMVDLSDERIRAYLKEFGGVVLSAVGCYKLELMGRQLFSKIEGHRETIMGLPMKAVGEFFKEQGYIINEANFPWAGGPEDTTFQISSDSFLLGQSSSDTSEL